MNRETIMAFSGRELDAAVAERVMGYVIREVNAEEKSWSPIYRLFTRSGSYIDGLAQDSVERCWLRCSPRYSRFADAFAEVEAEIERRGLQAKYVRLLWPLVNGPECPPNFFASEVFGFMTAPLDQKCRAALLAVLETEEKTNAE